MLIKFNLPTDINRHITDKSVYKLYLMLKQHFNGKYDVIKYNWNIRMSDAAYQKRKDKYFFSRLGERFKLNELIFLFMSNFVANQNAWVGDIIDSDAISFYQEYIGKLRRIDYIYEQEVKNIFYFAKNKGITLNEVIRYRPEHNSSYIFKLLQSDLISFETFIILDSFIPIIDEHDKGNELNIVWDKYSVRLKAYRKLLNINIDEAKKTFIEISREYKVNNEEKKEI